MSSQGENLNTKLPSAKNNSAFEALKAVTAAIAAVGGLEAGVRALVPDSTWGGILGPIIVTSALMVVCVYVIAAKTPRPSALIFTSQRVAQATEHRYKGTFRLFCTIGAIALTAVLLVRVWQILPNALVGKEYLSGLICNAGSGEPITSGSVEVLSRVGSKVSVHPQSLDDRGFFYIELKGWALPPRILQITSTACGPTQGISVSHTSPGLCVSRSMIPESNIDIQEWSLSCKNQ